MAPQKKVKITVEREFIDKHTSEKYKVGDVLNVTQRRYEEIAAKDKRLVSLVTE